MYVAQFRIIGEMVMWWAKRLLLVLATFIIAWALFGCTDSSQAGPTKDSGGIQFDGGNTGDGNVTNDIYQEQDTGEYKPGPGEFRAECKENEECDSDKCIETSDGKICTKTCDTGCEAGFICAPESAGDSIYYCFPRWVKLCDPCKEHKDCISSGSIDNKCVKVGGEGSFCGSSCEKDDQCPGGYVCQGYKDPETNETTGQCSPKDGALCKCSPRASKLGLSTNCSQKDDFKSCVGTRKCASSGLSKCLYPVSKEICDNVDNDCDGSTDEDPQALCDDGKPCTDETCDAGVCQNPLLDGNKCDNGSVCTEGYCNSGVCKNGKGVDCDDKNPCTIDSCDPVKGCVHVTDTGKKCQEQDENPCTDFRCYNGACVAKAPSKKTYCDDGNPCTLKDYCDKDTMTCAMHEAEPKCGDNNPCTIDKCLPDKGGCTNIPTNSDDDAKACKGVVPDCWLPACVGGVCSKKKNPNC